MILSQLKKATISHKESVLNLFRKGTKETAGQISQKLTSLSGRILRMSTWEQCQPGFMPVLSWPIRIFSMISPTSSNFGKEKMYQMLAERSWKVQLQQNPASPGHPPLSPFELPGVTFSQYVPSCPVKPAPSLPYICPAHPSLPPPKLNISLDFRTQFTQALGGCPPPFHGGAQLLVF